LKKILIIALDDYIQKAVGVWLQKLEKDIEIILSDHEKALEMLLIEEPQVVLVCDYCEELKNSSFALGEKTYTHLKRFITNEKIFRCGFSLYFYKDYIRFPCEIEKFQKILR
jgi:hypothetical protein